VKNHIRSWIARPFIYPQINRLNLPLIAGGEGTAARHTFLQLKEAWEGIINEYHHGLK